MQYFIFQAWFAFFNIVLPFYYTSPEFVAMIPYVTVEWSNSQFVKESGLLFLNGNPFSGKMEKCYPEGQLKSEQTFYRGKAQGWRRIWYENGQLAEQRFYQDNLQEGVAIGWWEDGAQRFKYHFKHDIYDGNCKDWFPNGQLYRDFNYKMGQEIGQQRMWWETGVIRANYIVKNGRHYGLQGRKLCNGVKE